MKCKRRPLLNIYAMSIAPSPSSASRTHGRRRLVRLGVVVFFASVAVNAALGIVALVAGKFSETSARILGTSLSVTGALLLVLACLTPWERRVLRPVPALGAAAGLIGFSCAIGLIWSDGESETLGKLTGTFMSVAVACTFAGLLALPRLEPRSRPVLLAALALDATAATMIAVTIWAEIDSSVYIRVFGVVTVLLAATAVSVPVLSRVGRADRPSVEPGAVSFCPFCGNRLGTLLVTVPVTCGGCSRTFTVVAEAEPDGATVT